jgi:hypothetical protein
VRVRVREFEGGAQQRRLIGLLGGGAMAMDDAVAEADLADPNPDVGDLFHHYDGLYFRGALAAAGFTAQWRSSSSPPLSRLGFSSSWLVPPKPAALVRMFKAAPFRAVRRWVSASCTRYLVLHFFSGVSFRVVSPINSGASFLECR